MTQCGTINQRDLRLRSKEIMDAVERGESFTVTRDGRQIGHLVPQQRRSRFISREAFVELGKGLEPVDWEGFRHDLDSAIEPDATDPYEQR